MPKHQKVFYISLLVELTAVCADYKVLIRNCISHGQAVKLEFRNRNHKEKSMIEIRKEKQKDYNKIRIVNDRAFGQPDEGRIVDKLRESCKEIVSLVAVSDNEIIGHIFF